MQSTTTNDNSNEPTTDQSATQHASPTDAADGGDLTRFQLEVLYVIGAGEGPLYGLRIKRDLEELYGQEVNHGRLYPNLDDLVDAGLIEKSERDKRTNEHSLTAEGRALVRHETRRLGSIADALGGDD